MKVSVVIPVYNQERYLKSTIPCVLNQTYKDLEILLIDDGSTDESPILLADFGNTDDRIRIVTQRNQGLVKAVSKGVREAKGEYICFVDPDDRIGKTYIEDFVAELDSTYDFVAMGLLRTDGKSVNPYYLKEDTVFLKEDIEKLRLEYLLSDRGPKFSNSVFVSRVNKIYKRDTLLRAIKVYEKYGKISVGEDSILTFLVLSESKKVKALRKPCMYYYNINNEKSMVSQKDVHYYLDNRCKTAFFGFQDISRKNNIKSVLPYELYFLLVKMYYLKMLELDAPKGVLISLQEELKNDDLFRKSCRCVVKKEKGKYKIIALGMIFWIRYFKVDPRALLRNKK